MVRIIRNETRVPRHQVSETGRRRKNIESFLRVPSRRASSSLRGRAENARRHEWSPNIILLATILIVFKSYSLTCAGCAEKGVPPSSSRADGPLPERYNQPLVILESNRTKRSLKAHKGN